MSDTAVVMVVPEAAGAAAGLRQRLDPAAAAGMPEHITLMYPFVDSDDVDAAVLLELGQIFAMVEPFDYELTAVGTFDPQVVYLAPEPSRPFVDLSIAITAGFGTKPYGGAFETVVPHLTLSQQGMPGPDELQAVTAALPIRCRAAQAALMVLENGTWRPARTFSLGS